MKFQKTFIFNGAKIYQKPAIKTDLKNQVFWNWHVFLGEQSISPRSLGVLEPKDECNMILQNLENYSLDTSRPRRRGSSHNLRLQKLSSSRNSLLNPYPANVENMVS